VLCAAFCVPLLIQQNVDGSNFFNRSWAEFKVGFKDSRGNYWLGNEPLHQLTVNGRYKLRVDLHNTRGSWYWAEYRGVAVLSEANSYKLMVSGYTGDCSDELSSQGAMDFTTYDRDNDWWFQGNCAVWNGGGFWYKSCGDANVNTIRNRGNGFKWYYNLLSIRMMLMC